MFQLPRQKIIFAYEQIDMDDKTYMAQMGQFCLNSPLMFLMLLAENLGMWDGKTDFHQAVSAEQEAFLILKYLHVICYLTLPVYTPLFLGITGHRTSSIQS